MYRHRFAAVYLLLATVLAGAVVVASKAWHPRPAARVTVSACRGVYGLERCLREQFAAQGAPEPYVNCSQRVLVALDPRYLCSLDVGHGSACYDVVAYRSPKDGYPIVQSFTQKPNC